MELSKNMEPSANSDDNYDVEDEDDDDEDDNDNDEGDKDLRCSRAPEPTFVGERESDKMLFRYVDMFTLIPTAVLRK